jgi:spore coat-associated protein N
MQRAAVLWRASPGRLVAALFALMLAAAMAVGSGANFNATSANPGNIVTAGDLKHSNDKDNAPIGMSTAKMKPGDTRTGTVAIENTGDIDGVFTLAGTVTDTIAGSGGVQLSQRLDLLIEDLGPDGLQTPVVKYGGPGVKLSTFPSTLALGTWAPGEKHVYRFTLTWPNGTPAQDNPFKGTQVELGLNWESQS